MRLTVCPSWARQLKSCAAAGATASAAATSAPAMKLRRVMALPSPFVVSDDSRCDVAAVDRDRDPVDQARGGRGEEHRRAGEFLRLRPALRRQPGHHLRVESLFLAAAAA